MYRVRPVAPKKFRGVCVFGMGDCGSESKITVNSLTDTINENMSSIVNSMISSSTQVCNANQTINVIFGPGSETINCDIASINTATMKCNMSALFTQTGATSIQSVLKQAVDNSAATSDTITQGFLSAGTKSDSTINMSTYIKNIIDNKITNNMANTCIQEATADQNNNLTFNGIVDCSKKGSISIGNTAQIGMVSSCISKQLNSILTSDTTVQDAISKSSVTSVQKSTGPIEEIGNAVSSILGQFGKMGMIIALVCVVIVIGAVIFLLSPAGQSATKDLAAAGSAKIKSS